MKPKNQIKWHKLYKQWWVLLLASCLITAITFGLCHTPFLQDLEHQVTDTLFRMDPRPDAADSSIVLVAVDDGSLAYFSQQGVSWPWPRSFYAHVVDYFADVGAEAVLFDMQFYEADLNREESYGRETDARFAKSISQAKNVFLAAQGVPDTARSHLIFPQFVISPPSSISPYHLDGVIAPIDTLQQSAAGVGLVNIFPDADGVIRRVPLLYRYHDATFPQFALAGWMQETPTADLTAIPHDKKGNYIINWYGDGLKDSCFTYLPFQAVIASASARMQGMKPLLPDSLFRNAHVIVGATGAGLMDLKTSPYSRIMPGMELWATVLSNLLNHDFITVAPQWLLALAVIFLVWIVLFAITHLKDRFSHLVLLAVILLICGVHYLLWMQFRILLWVTFFSLAILIAYLVSIIISYMVEGRSKREIRRLFTRYLHPDVIELLVQNPGQVLMGGAEIDATLLFTDIANFTTFSEGKHPRDLVQYLNEYLDRITGYVLENNGLLDKYTGDGIMAIFGAPVPRKDHALLACKMALQHKEFCASTADQDSVPLHFHRHTRIGIHSGKAVVGNIGSTKRMDYTAIGDTVNLASRLEGVNKVFGTDIIISEATWQAVKECFVCRELDYLRVKGKTKPTRIYELLGSQTPQQETIVASYEEALALYRQGEWKKALHLFDDLATRYSDPPAAKMATRCRILMKEKPKKWDGIFTLEAK